MEPDKGHITLYPILLNSLFKERVLSIIPVPPPLPHRCNTVGLEVSSNKNKTKQSPLSSIPLTLIIMVGGGGIPLRKDRVIESHMLALVGSK